MKHETQYGVLRSKTVRLLLVLSIPTASLVLNEAAIPTGWAIGIYAAFALLVISFMGYCKIPPFVLNRKEK